MVDTINLTSEQIKMKHNMTMKDLMMKIETKGQQACQGDYFKECVRLGQDIHNSKIFPLDATDVDCVRDLQKRMT